MQKFLGCLLRGEGTGEKVNTVSPTSRAFPKGVSFPVISNLGSLITNFWVPLHRFIFLVEFIYFLGVCVSNNWDLGPRLGLTLLSLVTQHVQ